MTRTTFIKSLLATGGLSFLPSANVRHYKKYYLLQCFVRGFRFYEGPALVQQMRQGDLVELVREPDNEHDECAIALHWNRKKIGYVPAENNELLSRLMDIGVPELMAEVGYVQTDAAAWEKVFAAVYVLKECKGQSSTQADYLTQLETPHYRSLKYADDYITRISTNHDDDGAEDEIGVNSYYDYLVENSKDDSMYGYIHEQLDPRANYEAQGDFLVVDTNELQAKSPTLLVELKKVESELYETDKMFDKEGMMVLNVRKATALIEKISGLGDVADKLGRKFIELKF
jgi:hypothetical protein